MKLRDGFVSNSSSSSFIVPIISDLQNRDYTVYKRYFSVENVQQYYPEGDSYSITLPLNRNSRFGWEEDVYDSFASKLDYLFLQIEGLPNNSRLYHSLKDSLETALKSICRKAYEIPQSDPFYFETHTDYNCIHADSIYDDYAYIDHQSAWWEKQGVVEEYFKDHKPSSDLIENYLVGDSYVQGGNDNSGMSDSYYESCEILEKYMQEG